MEPFTIISSAILSQLQTSAVVETIVSSFIGSRSDELICNGTKHLFNKIKNNFGEPANYDIQRAVRKAYLSATLVATEKVKKDDDLKEIQAYLKSELTLLDKPNTRFPKSELDEYFEQLLNPKGITIEERLPEIKQILKESLLYELKVMRLRVPLELKKIILNGWSDGQNTFDWYELMCAFASEEFKTNQRIQAIIQTDYLSVLSSQSGEINIKIDTVLNYLNSMIETYEPILPTVIEISKTVKKTEEKVDDLFSYLTEKHIKKEETEYSIQGIKISENYKRIKGQLLNLYREEEEIKIEIKDYNEEIKTANHTSFKRKVRLLEKAELRKLEINRAKLQTEKDLETLIQEVLKLAKLLENKEDVENTELNEIKILFENGKYDDVNMLLTEDKLYTELEANNKNRDALSQKFIIKSQSIVIEKKENWFESAKKFFNEAIKVNESYQNLFKYAHFMQTHNQNNEAIVFYKKSLKKLLGNTLYSSKHQKLISTILNNLASLQKNNNDFKSAENNYQKALEIERKHSKHSVSVADIFYNLANLQFANNNLNESIKYYQKALKIYKKLNNDTSNILQVSIASVFNGVAEIHYKKNDFDKAEKNHLKALEIRRKLALEKPNLYAKYLAESLNNVANLQIDNHDFKNAVKNLSEALEIRRKLSFENPYKYQNLVATTLNNLASLQLKNDNLQSAEKNYLESIEITRRLSKNNPEMHQSILASFLDNLATLQRINHNFPNAKKNHLEALEIRKNLAQVNPKVYLPLFAHNLNNLANFQDQINDYNNAKKNYLKALNIWRQLVQKQPRIHLKNLAKTLDNLANLQSKNNVIKNTKEYYIEALEIRRTLAKDNPKVFTPQLALTLNNYGNFQAMSQNLDSAEINILESLKLRRELALNNPNVYEYVLSQSLIAISLIQRDKLDFLNAEKNAFKAMEIGEKLIKSNPKKYKLYYASLMLNLSILYTNDLSNKSKSIQLVEDAYEYFNHHLLDIPYAQELNSKAQEIMTYWKNHQV